MFQEHQNEDRKNENGIGQINRRSVLKLVGATGAGLGVGLGTETLETGFVSPVRAASRKVVEDFDYSSSSVMKNYYHFETGKSNASLDTLSSTATSNASDSVLKISGGTTEMVAYDDNDGYDLQAYPQIGDTITCWLRGANATENMNVTYGAVDGDGRDDHYYVKVNMEQSLLGVGVTIDGNSSFLATATEDPSFSKDTWYKLEIKWIDGSTNTHDVTLYDQNGNSLASFIYDGSDSSDPNFEGRGFGFDAYVGGPGEVAYFDYAKTDGSSETTIISDGGDGSNIIDDFEDGDLSEYTHNTTRDGRAEIVSSPSLHGSQALAISNENAELISLPGDGLATYPSQGDRFEYHVRGTGSADLTNFTYGVQDHKNRYFIRVNIVEDRFKLF